MGLLTDWVPDDQVSQQGLLALASGLMAGRPSQGLLGFAQATSPENRAKLDLTKAQAEDLRQQVGLRNLQWQQQLQQWQLTQPIFQKVAAAFGGGGQPDFAAAPPASAMPSSAGAVGPGGAPGGVQPAGAPAAPVGSGPSGSVFGLPMNVAGPVLAMGGPQKFAEAISSYNAPTDFQKLLTGSGIDPSSPLGRQLVQTQLAKQNYTAPVNARQGGILRDPFSNQPIAFNPHVPEGTSPVFDASGNVTSFQPIGNAEAALGLSERARAFGKAQATPSVAYGPDGKPQFSTVAQDVQRAGNAPANPFANLPAPQAGVTGNFDFSKDSPEEIISAIAGIKNPQERANAYTAFAQQMKGGGSAQPSVTPVLAPGVAPGVAQGAQLSQEELSRKWSDLNGMNAQAQTTKSYLDSIKQLASKAAVGPFTDKLQLTNALLGFAGSDRATDATTANDLLTKYGNQIVSRLGGSGGMGTDAARAILQSAYPNAHMTQAAINEAADNLIGANAMVQAKARFLQQAASTRDPQAYQQRELAFDQAADPRLWQLANMDAASAQSYLAKMPPSVRADLQKKAVALKQAGAL